MLALSLGFHEREKYCREERASSFCPVPCAYEAQSAVLGAVRGLCFSPVPCAFDARSAVLGAIRGIFTPPRTAAGAGLGTATGAILSERSRDAWLRSA